MNKTGTHVSAALCTLFVLSASAAIWAQEPQYKANVPASVTTPDKLRTEVLGAETKPNKGSDQRIRLKLGTLFAKIRRFNCLDDRFRTRIDLLRDRVVAA